MRRVVRFLSDPTILLIHGACASMLWWPRAFCARSPPAGGMWSATTAATPGRSTHYPPGRPSYSLRDLADDAVGLLDALAVPAAHVVGRSMGGGVAMVATLDHPERIATLTLVGTTTGADDLPRRRPRSCPADRRRSRRRHRAADARLRGPLAVLRRRGDPSPRRRRRGPHRLPRRGADQPFRHADRRPPRGRPRRHRGAHARRARRRRSRAPAAARGRWPTRYPARPCWCSPHRPRPPPQHIGLVVDALVTHTS